MKVASFFLVPALLFAGCGGHKGDPAAEAPPPAQVVQENEQNVFAVEHPEQFSLTEAVEHDAGHRFEPLAHPETGRSGFAVDEDARLVARHWPAPAAGQCLSNATRANTDCRCGSAASAGASRPDLIGLGRFGKQASRPVL